MFFPTSENIVLILYPFIFQNFLVYQGSGFAAVVGDLQSRGLSLGAKAMIFTFFSPKPPLLSRALACSIH